MSSDQDALVGNSVAKLEKTEYRPPISGVSLVERKLGIEPQLSVLPPRVKLVDANLAYKYADLQGDVNLLLGFTTLFLGTGLASTTSLIVSLFAAPLNQVAVAIHSCFTAFSSAATAVFWCLTRRAQRRSDQAKSLLETDIGLKELILHTFVEDGTA